MPKLSRYQTDPEYREHKKQQARATYAAKGEEILATRKATGYNTKQFQKNKPAWHNRHLIKTYGIDRDEYLLMLTQQNGQCRICGSTEPGGNADQMLVDHSHRSGKVRGLLCLRCNSGLGMFEDSPRLLAAAIDYLKEER